MKDSRAQTRENRCAHERCSRKNLGSTIEAISIMPEDVSLKRTSSRHWRSDFCEFKLAAELKRWIKGVHPGTLAKDAGGRLHSFHEAVTHPGAGPRTRPATARRQSSRSGTAVSAGTPR